MPKIPIGVQLYSVRDDCKKDFLSTLKAVAKMGYSGVEFAGYHNWAASDLRKTLDDLGLKCCGTHTSFDSLQGAELQKTIDYNLTIGNKYLIVPWLPEDKRNSREACIATSKALAEVVEKVKKHGLLTGYHTHDCDCKPLRTKDSAWEVIGDNTPPAFVLQLDTANAMHGGADPIALLKKYPGRTKTIHLKEMPHPDKKDLIGEGQVKWKDVFSICESTGGTDWYIVEHEIYGMSPLECIDGCLKNLRKMGK